MRYAFLILFVPMLALAQPNFQQQVQIASAGVAAASGGGGVSGPPGIVSSVTNSSGSSVSSLTTNIVVSGNNTALVWFYDWAAPATSTPNTPTWKGSNTGVTQWTNFMWGDFGTDKGYGMVYYLMNPSSGSGAAAVSWSANVAEVCMYVICLTNCSGFEVGNTNFQASAAVTLSIDAASQTKDLMLFFSVVGADGLTPTFGGSQNLVSYRESGVGEHAAAITTKSGSAGTDTSSSSWNSGAPPSGAFNGGAIGY